MIAQAIDAEGRRQDRLCGQAPSDHPQFAEFLVECGIDCICVSPDSIIAVKRMVAAAEARQQSGQ